MSWVVSADDLERATEEAEQAAKALRRDLSRARTLVEEMRERLERQAVADLLDSDRALYEDDEDD